MAKFSKKHGFGTLVTHFAEGHNPHHAHITPIYQTSTFSFPDVATGAATFAGQQPGYVYTRIGNPNVNQLATKIAALEGWDLLRANPDADPEAITAGLMFASGMAAVTSAILARAKSGDTLIVQEAIYGNTFTFLHEIGIPEIGLNVVWVRDTSPAGWRAAFEAHPHAVLAYAESPANPTMDVVDLQAVAEIAHHYGAWAFVDNTFASPYCQRPLSLGCDVVIHSTTKYLSGHGVIVGGAVVSKHVEWVRTRLKRNLKAFGGSASPFDAWLTNMGLKTLELRMQRHSENALTIARYLQNHPKVARVFYPGLPEDPGHEIACKQMHAFGGMLSFELKGGLAAGETLMNAVQIATLAVSLGNVDTLIEHPASMTHAGVPQAERELAGITDGLVRLSVGIENVQDLLDDLEQGLAKV